MSVLDDAPPALADALRRIGLDTVEGAFAYGGGDELDKPGLAHRRRTRLAVTDANGMTHELYLKRYHREGFAARLRRWRTYGIRTSPAGVELANIQALRAAGVDTMQAVACGQEWDGLDARRSYLIVTAVPGERLEDAAGPFMQAHADSPEAISAFTASLAEAVRRFHAAGFVHRDLYACHLFLDDSSGAMRWYFIDLARVFRPRFRRTRWRVKDLAELKFSVPDAWSEAYGLAFLTTYLGEVGEANVRRWSGMIDRKVARMRRRESRRGRI